MKLFHSLCAAAVALAATGAAAAPRYVNRIEVSVMAEPRGNANEVGKLALGAKVEAGERKKRWIAVTFDGKPGWVPTGALSKKPLTERWLCARGQAALTKDNLTAAIIYLRGPFDAGTKRRDCLESLASAYRRRGQSSDEASVRARIRRLENWLVGSWCDTAQRLALKLGDDGRFDFRAGTEALGTGKYDLRDDEVVLEDDRGPARNLTLFVRKRGHGRILVSRSAEELLPQFCQ
jgi:hypothetical protein